MGALAGGSFNLRVFTITEIGCRAAKDFFSSKSGRQFLSTFAPARRNNSSNGGITCDVGDGKRRRRRRDVERAPETSTTVWLTQPLVRPKNTLYLSLFLSLSPSCCGTVGKKSYSSDRRSTVHIPSLKSFFQRNDGF